MTPGCSSAVRPKRPSPWSRSATWSMPTNEQASNFASCRRLAPLYGAWEHSFHFSGIRLRNAVGWPETAPSAAASAFRDHPPWPSTLLRSRRSEWSRGVRHAGFRGQGRGRHRGGERHRVRARRTGRARGDDRRDVRTSSRSALEAAAAKLRAQGYRATRTGSMCERRSDVEALAGPRIPRIRRRPPPLQQRRRAHAGKARPGKPDRGLAVDALCERLGRHPWHPCVRPAHARGRRRRPHREHGVDGRAHHRAGRATRSTTPRSTPVLSFSESLYRDLVIRTIEGERLGACVRAR